MTDKSLGTFISPFTEFGFKKIFGSEESKRRVYKRSVIHLNI